MSEEDSLFSVSKSSVDEEALINKRLPKELLLNIFSFLDVVSLCRCAQVSKYWEVLAKDGSNWKTIDLFSFQTDISSEVVENLSLACKGFLRQLSLRGCKNISDAALITFSDKCRNIEFLNLNDCRKLTDVAIEKLGTNCKKLINLNLTSCNEITDSSLISISRGCTRLRYLDISYCTKITVDGITAIAVNCSNLISFKARMPCSGQAGNNLNDDSLIAIADNLTQLETLNVQGWYNLTDNSVHRLGEKCKELQYLCLTDCKELNDYALISISENCTKLKALEVTRCERLTDNSFRVLANNCHELTSLDLEEVTQITDNTLSFLSTGCPLLEKLILSLCEQISDHGIRFITSTASAAQNLKVLELDNCPMLTDRSLEYLSQCTALERIEVYDDQGLSRNAIKEFMKSNPNLKVHTYFNSLTPNEAASEPRTARDSRCCIIL